MTKACTITANFSLNSYTVTFASNTGGTVNRTSQSVPYGTSITVSNNTVTTNGITTTATASSGYKFKDWTNGCGTTMPANNCTITATWNDVRPAIQSYTKSQCSTNASSASVVTKDLRDNKSYRIRYINGVCTMVDNLNFDLVSNMALSTSTTNVASNRTLASVETLYQDLSYHELRFVANNYGGFYNFAAVTAGTITGSSNTANVSQDICPANWRLPTNSEQQTIANATESAAIFSATTGGWVEYGGINFYHSLYGAWWSSTSIDADHRYAMSYSNSEKTLTPGSSFSLDYGVMVRCVRK